jgi:hypothetical protein
LTFIIYKHNEDWIIRDENNPHHLLYYKKESDFAEQIPAGGTTLRCLGAAPAPVLSFRHNCCEFSEDEVDSHLVHHTDSYTAFYRNESLKDCRITYDGTILKAHKAFLASVSLYFQRLFSGEWRESSECSIQPLAGIELNDFRAFLIICILSLRNF